VARGEPYVTGRVAQELALRSRTQSGGGESLSPREFEVLRMLVAGKSLPDIAECLGLTAKTVANHQSNLRQKLGVGSALQLLQAAARLGITPESTTQA